NILVMNSKEADYQYFNVGTGKPTSVLDIAKTLSRLYGKEPKVIIKNEYRVGDIRHCFADISKIKKLGFKPSVNFDDGMREMVEWGKRASSVDRVNEADKMLAKMNLKI
ncbi:MAG: nucleoside-diphosphate sugar epimerase, partial [Candidatus Omnitrophica bacterium]|nr:nucleoside-diphosphate sugar epimerase [Candidatus Omnitrophota bacterium]